MGQEKIERLEGKGVIVSASYLLLANHEATYQMLSEQ
jgi:hypothetical protein